MARPISASIDVTKIDKTLLVEGRSGKYLDLVFWPMKNGEDERGNTHIVKQGSSKADREAGRINENILGNAKFPKEEVPHRMIPEKKAAPIPSKQEMDEDDSSDIPF